MRWERLVLCLDGATFELLVSINNETLAKITSKGGESVLASRRLAKRDGIPHHTDLGKGPLFLIYSLSVGTAHEYVRPT